MSLSKTQWTSGWDINTILELGNCNLQYKYVEKEVPIYKSLVDGSNLWETLPRMKTKLNITNRFETHYAFDISSLHIYLNGSDVVNSASILSNKLFELPTWLSDGYLYVTYDFQLDVHKVIDIERTEGIIYGNRYPKIKPTYIVELREAINRIMLHLGLSPFLWLGGIDGNTYGLCNNIDAQETPVLSEHIYELINNIYTIINYIMTISRWETGLYYDLPENGSEYKTSADTINRIRKKINDIENVIIEQEL